MIKLILFLLSLLLGALVAAYRVRQGRKIMQELEAKERCLYCDSNDVRERLDGGIDCMSCGQVTSAILLSANAPTDAELKALSKPSEHQRPF